MIDYTGIFVSAVIFFSIVAIVKIIYDNKTRSRLIEKGLVDENIKFLFQKSSEYQVPSSLKWGMVLIGVGLAFLIGRLVPSDISKEVTIGAMFLFAGVGLVLYYFIAIRIAKKSKEKDSEK